MSNKRLDREEWLKRSLQALSKKGPAVLSVDALVKHLGVSRGSFYWHFKDKSDFVRQLVNYWSESFTKPVAIFLSQTDLSAEKKLLLLMEKIVTDKLTQYDIPVRAWASHDPAARRMVKQNDDFRYQYVRSLLSEIGFKGEELEMRTQTFVVYYSFDVGMFYNLPKKKQLEQARLRHAMLVRKYGAI